MAVNTLQDLHFSIDSALLRELGEKLVETVHIALAELVKNAYDADATRVEIVFETDSKGASQIKIIDDGIGMNFDSVRNYWMRIATNNKEVRDTSAVFGRPLTGAKGIGRFSCRRLGTHLKLITYGTKAGKNRGKQRLTQRTEVDFPWNDFEPGTEITKIKCKGEMTEVPNHDTGTTLIISDISDEWGTRGMNWLKRQLGVLAANRGARRDGFLEDPGFNVRLIAPEFEGGVRDLREDLINAGWGTLTAYINNKHQAVCELNAMGVGRRTIKSSKKFEALKDIFLKIGIMVDLRWQLRDSSVLSLGSLEKILPEWGGVQVRYRGFRVYPYGDDDWLGIDNDRGLRKGNPKDELLAFASTLRGVDPGRSLLNLLSMRSHVGSVDIGEDAEGFEMKLNREGFVHSEAVDQLKEFVRFSIDWATILRDYQIRQESQRESFAAKVELENVLEKKIDSDLLVETAVSYLEGEVSTLAEYLEPEQRTIVKRSLLRATDAIRKQNSANLSELSHLRLVASTANLVLIFSHEVRSLLGLLENSKESLVGMIKGLSNKQKETVSSIVAEFSDLQERLNELLELTTIVGIDQRKAKPGQVALKPKIEKTIKVFELIVKKYSINIDYSNVPNNIALTKILESEVYSVLINVLSNAIKSVIAVGKNRRIEISARKEGADNVITFKDSGLGLSPDRFEEVFVPFISDPDGRLYDNLNNRLNPEDKLIVGTGSGLGLGIVKEIINAHNGSIRFTKPEKNWNAQIEIKLP
jgi:signal transduction histidine kinase/anti-sigma regulatory factor (Ser/Thr protein kinase)